MKVTVLLTTFNHAAYVRQAVESALAQRTPFDFDILVADDASTDGTREIVKSFRARYPERISLFFPETNMGASGNAIFLAALSQCRGQYVAFLDGDDFWTAGNKLDVQVGLMEARPELSGCFNNVEIWEGSDSQPKRRIALSGASPVYRFDDLVEGNVVPASSALCRRAIAVTAPQWMEGVLGCDWMLQLVCAQHGPIAYIDQVMGVYRYHGRGVWSSLTRVRQLEEVIAATECIAENFGEVDPAHIKRVLGRHWADLAIAHRIAGNTELAFRAARSALRIGGVTHENLFRLILGWTRPTRYLQRMAYSKG